MTATDLTTTQADDAHEVRDLLRMSPDQLRERLAGLAVRERFYRNCHLSDMAAYCRTRAELHRAALDPVGRAQLQFYAELHD